MENASQRQTPITLKPSNAPAARVSQKQGSSQTAMPFKEQQVWLLT
jgi:hypothetical protein